MKIITPNLAEKFTSVIVDPIRKDRTVLENIGACVASIFLGVATLGVAHLGCTWWRNAHHIEENETTDKIKNIYFKIFPRHKQESPTDIENLPEAPLQPDPLSFKEKDLPASSQKDSPNTLLQPDLPPDEEPGFGSSITSLFHMITLGYFDADPIDQRLSSLNDEEPTPQSSTEQVIEQEEDNKSSSIAPLQESPPENNADMRIGEESELIETNLSEAGQAFIDIIEKDCSEDISIIWKNLLANIPAEDVKAFETNIKTGQSTITFKRPLSFWLNTRSRTDGKLKPEGGTILLLGHNKSNTLTFTNDPKTKKIEFKTGLNYWLRTPIGIRILDINTMKEIDNKKIQLDIGTKVGFIYNSRTTDLDTARTQEVWGKATLLKKSEDYKDYLNHKIASGNQQA